VCNRREDENMCGGSPLISVIGDEAVIMCGVSCRGDSQERRIRILTLVLPSLN